MIRRGHNHGNPLPYARWVSSRAPAAHTTHVLTLSQVIQGTTSPHNGRLPMLSGTRVGTPTRGAGIQIQMPPLVTWRARLPELLPVIEAYLSVLRDGPQPERAQGSTTGRPWYLPGPLFLSLRLFPDASLAQLENRPAPALSLEDEAAGTQRSGACLQERRTGPTPLQRVPLSAFLHRDQHPWGTGLEPQQAFKLALEGLTYFGGHLACRIPVVLIVPTRLMVSQSFCEGLLRVAAQAGISTVALELPSTATLLEKETQAEREAYGRVAAVTQRWHRLSPVCTDWEDLTRDPTFRPLRSVSRHQVMPLHVLLPWMRSQGLLDSTGVEWGLTMDTTPPRTHYAKRRARLEGPSFLLDRDAQEALAYDGPDHSGSREARRVADLLSQSPAIHGHTANVEDEAHARMARHEHVYMSSPLDKALTRSWSSQSDNARRDIEREAEAQAHQGENSGNRATRWSATAGAAEEALRRQHRPQSQRTETPHLERQPVKKAGMAPSTSHTSAGAELSLGPVPDDVRDLILRSVQKESSVAREERGVDGAPWRQMDPSGADGDHNTAQQEAAGRALRALLTRAVGGDDEASASPTRVPGGHTTSFEDELAFLQRRARRDARAAAVAAVDDERSDEAQLPLPSAAGRRQASADGDTHASSSSLCGAGYWQCISCLSHRVLPAAFHMTMPTLNATQARAWHQGARSTSTVRTAVHRTNKAVPEVPLVSHSLPFLPVLLPLLSPAALEAQRLLREGPRRPRHGTGSSASVGTTADSDAHSLLGPLDPPLAALLDRATSDGRSPRGVLRALASQRPTLRDDQYDDGSDTDAEADHVVTDSISQEGMRVVRSRRRRNGAALRPLEYARPHHVGPHSVRLVDTTQGDAAAAFHAEEVEFVSETMKPALRDAAEKMRYVGSAERAVEPDGQTRAARRRPSPPENLLALSLPSPGLTTQALVSSWDSLFS